MRRARRRCFAQTVSAAALALVAFEASAQEPGEAGAESAPILIGVTVTGSTLISEAELGEIYEPYLARPYAISDLVDLAEAITQHYRARGYFLSRATVPEQTMSGLARIHVLEGEINEVVVEGPAANVVRPTFDTFSGGHARLSELDRLLTRADAVPGVRLRAHLEPNVDDPLEHRLIVHADRDRLSGMTYLDNRGPERVGPWQLYTRVNVNGALLERDQLGVGVFTTPLDAREFALLELSYQYVFGSDARIHGDATASVANGGPDAVSAEVGGESQGVRVGYAAPLLRGRTHNLWLDTGLAARSVTYDRARGVGFSDELRVAHVALRGTLNEEGRASVFALRLSTGLDALGASGAAPGRRSRADADAAFFAADLHASHYRDVGRYFGVFGSISAQWADEPLLASQEFDAGGLPYGRAFAYGAISGDRGVAALAEVRAGYDPPGALLSFAQAYAFVDTSHVWDVGIDNYGRLSSSGVGLRATLANRVTARWEWARALAAEDPETREAISVLVTY